MKNLLTVFLALLLISQLSYSQIELVSDCNSISVVHELSSLDGFSANLESNGNSSTMLFCQGDGVVDNPNWLAFTIDPYFEYTLQVTFSNCVPGQSFEAGGQLGIYDSCNDWSNPIYCFVDEINGTHNIPAETEFEVGTTYYLLLDGFKGSVCDVNISVERYLPMESVTDWYYVAGSFGGSSTYWYSDIGDTLINGLEYRVIEISSNPDFPYNRFLREDADRKVYEYSSFSEQVNLLYDFAATLGDVISTANGSFTVVDIDYVESEYGPLKRWKLEGPGPPIYVREGIGSEDLFLANTVSDPVFGLLCAYHEEDKLYGNQDCDPAPRWLTDSTFVSVEICEGELYEFGGNQYIESGIYMDTLINVAGSDSIIILELSVLNISTNNIQHTLCTGDSIIVDGTIFDETNPSGTILFPNGAASGCDSIVIVDLLFVNNIIVNYQSIICEGNFQIWGGDTINVAGDYSFDLVSSTGCDSTINLSVQIIDDIVTEMFLEACNGEAIIIDGETYTESGIYQSVFSASTSCDSVVIYNLSFLPLALESDTLFFCPGDSVIVNGEFVFTEGNYQTVFNDINGCDSIQSISVIELLPSDSECLTSVDDLQSLDLSISPNPYNHSLSLSAEEDIQSIEIINVSGIQVDSRTQLGRQTYTYDGSDLAAGIYILKVRSKDKIAIKRIVKN